MFVQCRRSWFEYKYGGIQHVSSESNVTSLHRIGFFLEWWSMGLMLAYQYYRVRKWNVVHFSNE